MTSDDASPLNIVYEDEYIFVDAAKHQIGIKWSSYISLHPSKPHMIDLTKVVYLDPAPDVCRPISSRSWGPSPTAITWGRDWYRGLSTFGVEKGKKQFEKSFVVKLEGDVRRFGFTVDRKDEFLAAVERACPGISNKHIDRSKEEYTLIHDA